MEQAKSPIEELSGGKGPWRYYKGFPASYRWKLINEAFWIMPFLVIFAALSLGLLAMAVWAMYLRCNILIIVLLSAGGVLFAFVFKCIFKNLPECFHAYIVPYFEKETRGGFWFKSMILARHQARLDELAVTHGFTPLSKFEMPLRVVGRPLFEWHESTEGLKTMRGLVGLLNDNPSLISDSSEVMADLEKIIKHLEYALKCDATFRIYCKRGRGKKATPMSIMAMNQFDPRQQRSSSGNGMLLARNCQKLDRLAVINGLMPISQFGFGDDGQFEQVHWHDPREGLTTLRGLTLLIHKYSDEFPNKAEVIADLESATERLEHALNAGVRFCFILVMGNPQVWASGNMMLRRKGKFV